jgi:hypothetical protein
MISTFMTDSQRFDLPDRKEITLCEAVTTFVYGNASDSLWLGLECPEETDEHRIKANDLLGRLQSAAYAGRIKLRALKKGETHLDGHKEIDPLYFGVGRGFDWHNDKILNQDFDDPVGEPREDWHDVHLDREGFEALLREMGLSVQRKSQTTFKTGYPGRTTARHAVLELAQQRFERGDVPPTIAEFARQLADELKSKYPQAPSTTPKTIANHIRSLFNAHQARLRQTPKPS